MQAKYEYAKSNGCTMTYSQYLEFNYSGYCAICNRCDVVPMSYTAWLTK